jgi:hypothetical protein
MPYLLPKAAYAKLPGFGAVLTVASPTLEV